MCSNIFFLSVSFYSVPNYVWQQNVCSVLTVVHWQSCVYLASEQSSMTFLKCKQDSHEKALTFYFIWSYFKDMIPGRESIFMKCVSILLLFSYLIFWRIFVLYCYNKIFNLNPSEICSAFSCLNLFPIDVVQSRQGSHMGFKTLEK